MLEYLGVELPLGVVGLGAELVPKVSSDRKKILPLHRRGDPTGPSYSWCWGRCCVLLTSDPMIIRVLEHLGVELPLGVVGLDAEFEPKVCSGHWPRPEG